MRAEDKVDSPESPFAETIVLLNQVPSERTEDKTYCSVMQNGTYDIHLTDHSGNVIVVLDRICAIFTESHRQKDGSRPEAFYLDSRYAGTIKESYKDCKVAFQTEFFLKASPTTTFHITQSTGTQPFGCNAHGPITNASIETLDPTRSSLIEKSADSATLHITYYYKDC